MREKLTFLLIFILLLSLPVIAQTSYDTDPNGYNKFYYASGKISSEGNLVNGKPEGNWKSYHENGNLKSEGGRKDHRLSGEWKFYNEDGKLSTSINYKEGKKDGITTEYYENGNKKSEITYTDEVKTGEARYYHENGKLQKVIPFVDGLENGISYEYDENGSIISVLSYKRGFFLKREEINRTDKFGLKQGIWKDFYSNGQPKWEISYKDDKKHGFYKEYTKEGFVTNFEEYQNDSLVTKGEQKVVKLEIAREFHPGGVLKSIGSYDGDRPVGVFHHYDTQGNVEKATVYQQGKRASEGKMDAEGKKQGLWNEFYPDGKLKAKGDYKDNLKEGKWIYFYPDGVVEQEGVFAKGKPEGIWKWYYPNGALLREENYKKGKEEGKMTEYAITGEIIGEGQYYDGLRDGQWKFQNGEYIAEGEYIEGKMVGKWIQTFPSGGIAFEGEYFDGDENGTHRYFYPDGKLREERIYRIGIRDGVWKIYDEFGTPIVSITYENGKETKLDGVKIITTSAD